MKNIQNKILPQKDCEWMICLFNFLITNIPMKNIFRKTLSQEGLWVEICLFNFSINKFRVDRENTRPWWECTNVPFVDMVHHLQ